MATIAEKLRACVVLDEGAFAHVCVLGSKALTLDVEDLTALADTVELGEQFDFDVSRATCAMSRELDLAKLEASEARGQAAALNAELDAAKAEVAAPKAKLEESAVVADAVAWLVGGQSPVVTTSAAAAQICSKDGLDVVPLYLRPPAAEALPTREDLETVVRECLRISDLYLGVQGLGLREEGERFAICEWDDEIEDVDVRSFAEAVTEAAAILRAKKAEV